MTTLSSRSIRDEQNPWSKTNKKKQEDLGFMEHIYNPISEMGFSAMFTFQLDTTKR